MPATRRSLLVYVLLAGVWLVVAGWQIEEHARVNAAARTDLRNRSREIAKTVGASIRNMRFWGAVRQERLDDYLNELVHGRTNELVQASDLLSVVLLNAAGEPVASAGRPIDLEQKDLVQEGERWGQHSVTLINPVNLGASLTSEGVTNTFLLPRRTDLTNRVRSEERRV